MDDSGAVDEVDFVGPFELSDVLLDDERFRSCFVQTWRRHVRGSYACGDDLGADVGLVSPLVDVPATYGYRHRAAGAEEGDTPAQGERPGTVPDVPTGSVDVRFNVVVNNDWGTGYCADGSVTNGSDTTVTWSGRWPQDGTINNIWNASYTEQGAEWEFRGADFNAELEPGGTASFGFCADR
ncbi:MAG: cellulose binding domain-containing protein [Myxococcales bacterium]|nr:cellulose binding domain-containing protein [Myxococcales bacterium]